MGPLRGLWVHELQRPRALQGSHGAGRSLVSPNAELDAWRIGGPQCRSRLSKSLSGKVSSTG